MKFAWLILGMALALPAKGQDLSYKARSILESHEARGDSPFAPGLPLVSLGKDRGRLEGEVRGKAGPVSLLLTGTYAAQDGRPQTGKIIANEVYTDFSAGGERFSMGKKILSGDVGYGFRPIDVLQREARLQVLPPALEGVPNVAWERFSAEEAWSVFWTNPGHSERGDAKSDGSVAARYYRKVGATDLHGVARASDRFGLEAGGAFSSVPSESLEIHASFLQMRRGERPVPLPESATPQQLLNPDLALQTQIVERARKALAGFTLAHASGWSFIGELWWDGTAPTASDWRSLGAEARRRAALAGAPGVPAGAVAGSIAASTGLFSIPNVSRRAALAHIGWTDPGGNGWSAALDLLRTLEDGGHSITAAVGWEADKLRIDAGIRRFGGNADSAYRLLPERGILFVGASFAF